MVHVAGDRFKFFFPGRAQFGVARTLIHSHVDSPGFDFLRDGRHALRILRSMG